MRKKAPSNFKMSLEPPLKERLRKRAPSKVEMSLKPPLDKRLRERAPSKVETSLEPIKISNLPHHVLETILWHAVAQGDEEVDDSSHLPANGSARQNYRLSSLIRSCLNKDLTDFLHQFLWKKIQITHHNGWRGKEATNALERLAENFMEIKRCTKTFEVVLWCAVGHELVPPALYERIKGLFEVAHKRRVREISLNFHAAGHLPNEENSETDNTTARIDKLMKAVPTFEKLTTFKFMMGGWPHVSESCLAFIIGKLPELHTIDLCGCHNVGNFIEYPEDLGRALASRTRLKSLKISRLRTFTVNWLDLDWQASLEGLEVRQNRFNDHSVFDEMELLRFCHIFRRTLVSLGFHRELGNHPSLDEELALAQVFAKDFGSLKYLSYSGNLAALWAFASSPNIEELTWWIIDSDPWTDSESKIEAFKNGYSPGRGNWSSLGRVNIPSQSYQQTCEDHWIEFDRFLESHAIVLYFPTDHERELLLNRI